MEMKTKQRLKGKGMEVNEKNVHIFKDKRIWYVKYIPMHKTV